MPEPTDKFDVFKELTIKFGLTLICLSGFLYQIYLLLTDYLSGVTVVSITVERIQLANLPGLTVCLPKFLSLELAAQNHQEIGNLYEDYNNELAKFNAGTAEQTLPDNYTEKNMVDLETKMLDKLSILSLPVYDLMTKYSIPSDALKIYIGGYINETEARMVFFTSFANPKNFKLVESFSFDNISGFSKCFTAFSYLDPVSQLFKIDLRFIFVELDVSYKWFPLHNFDKIFLKLHSPNSLPDMLDDAVKILVRVKNSFTFNEITTELLDNKKNCYEYDLDYKFANFNMRSDCITTCIEEFISKQCNVYGFTYSGYLLRKELLEQKDVRNKPRANDNNNCQFESKNEANFECKKRCKPDCSFTYYSMDKNREEVDEWTLGNKLTFIIQHNSMPDVVIKYLPQTTFLSLVCNFGGLLGMWLGLSFLTIFDKIFSILKELIRKYATFNNNNNTLITNNYSINMFMKRDRPSYRLRHKPYF